MNPSTQPVRRFFEAYKAHDLDAMVAMCDFNADMDYVPFEVARRQRVVRGTGKVHGIGKTIWSALIDAFPDLSNDITWIDADGQGNVAVEVHIGGTQAKAFGTIPAASQRYWVPHLFTFKVNDRGLITGISAFWDGADMNRQLGYAEVD
ncbi:MAG: hypothetical protein FJY42_12390 [Betaproteobacteria bacterium]|nr:hypothetical protein [Betaproteobacteria bacterium]